MTPPPPSLWSLFFSFRPCPLPPLRLPSFGVWSPSLSPSIALPLPSLLLLAFVLPHNSPQSTDIQGCG